GYERGRRPGRQERLLLKLRNRQTIGYFVIFECQGGRKFFSDFPPGYGSHESGCEAIGPRRSRANDFGRRGRPDRSPAGLVGIEIRVVEDGGDEGSLPQFGQERGAFGLEPLVADGGANLVLDLRERGGTGGAAILDLHDVEAAGSLEDLADLPDRQRLQG